MSVDCGGKKAAGALLTARLAEGGKNLWTVELSTKSPFERRATDMPDTIATLFPCAIFCASTRTTSPDDGTWIVRPSTVMTDKISGALLTGDKAEGSGDGRVWA